MVGKLLDYRKFTSFSTRQYLCHDRGLRIIGGPLWASRSGPCGGTSGVEPYRAKLRVNYWSADLPGPWPQRGRASAGKTPQRCRHQGRDRSSARNRPPLSCHLGHTHDNLGNRCAIPPRKQSRITRSSRTQPVSNACLARRPGRVLYPSVGLGPRLSPGRPLGYTGISRSIRWHFPV